MPENPENDFQNEIPENDPEEDEKRLEEARSVISEHFLSEDDFADFLADDSRE